MIGNAMTSAARAMGCVAVLSLGLLLATLGIGAFGLISPARSESTAPAISQPNALAAYTDALNRFKAVLKERRAQISAKQPLPNLPGQALYLARIGMMSAYKDLTDALPAKIGRPNKFAIPPAYFDADNEPLIDEYLDLFRIMQAPPANAQISATPFKDIVELGTVIARAKGLDAADADVAGRIALGLFFAETNGQQNIGNARSNTYKGSRPKIKSAGRNGRRSRKPSPCSIPP